MASADKNLGVVQSQLVELDAHGQAEIDAIGAPFDAATAETTEVRVVR
ncbi:MAG: hypothetical protein MUE41_05640 [Gemmatimonadaceae bacterium]|nr:hypothetical protein [Gemmatimonadaceae bacterium]